MGYPGAARRDDRDRALAHGPRASTGAFAHGPAGDVSALRRDPRGLRAPPGGPRPGHPRAAWAAARTLRVRRLLLCPGALARAGGHRAGVRRGHRGGPDPPGCRPLGHAPGFAGRAVRPGLTWGGRPASLGTTGSRLALEVGGRRRAVE